jgi:acyl dehydratase
MSRELIPVRKAITIERMRSYSGEDNIHGSDEAGEAWGLGGALVQGGQLVGYLNEMMTRTLGAGFLKGGEIAVSFVQPVRTGDVVVSGGELSGEHYVAGRLRLDYDVWLTNQNGDKVTVGKASGWARQD